MGLIEYSVIELNIRLAISIETLRFIYNIIIIK